MAVNEFLECATALSFMLADKCDDGDLQMYHQIDLKEFEESTHFKNYSPVYVLSELNGFKVKTCVRKLRQDCYSVDIIILQRYVKAELVWPVKIEWQAYVLHEDNEESLQLKNESMEFKKQDEHTKNDFCFSFQVTKAEVQDFIKDDKLCFRWTIKFLTQQKLNGVKVPTVEPCDPSFRTTDCKKQLNDMLSKIHTFGESLNSSKSKDEFERIAKAVSDCDDTKLQIEKIEKAVRYINTRMEVLKDKFVEQRKVMEQFISDLDHLRQKRINDAPAQSSTGETSCEFIGCLEGEQGKTGESEGKVKSKKGYKFKTGFQTKPEAKQLTKRKRRRRYLV